MLEMRTRFCKLCLMFQETFFSFSAALGTLHEVCIFTSDINLHCFATVNIFVVESDM
jgi:hypothetical protein